MAAKGAGVLPLYQRYVNGVPVTQARRTLRLREKYIILLVFMTFTTVCTCAFLFLPNLQDRVSIVEVRKQLQDAGGLFFPQARLGPDGSPLEKGKFLPHDTDVFDHHITNDKEKLQFKINEAKEHEKLNEEFRKNVKPEEEERLKESIRFEKENILKKQKEEEEKKRQQELEEAKKVNKDHEGHPGARGGEPSDPDVKAKRDKIKEVSNSHHHQLLLNTEKSLHSTLS